MKRNYATTWLKAIVSSLHRATSGLLRLNKRSGGVKLLETVTTP